jgi:dihydrofolate reductase
MGTIVFSTTMSLDGYTADASGNFDFAAPDVEVHAFVNDRQREIGTYIFGRRMYETMRVWETLPDADDDSEVVADFAEIWRGTDKIVVSSTLDDVTTARTRLVRSFAPDVIRDLAIASPKAVCIGGSTLAAEAFRAGIIDEVQLYIAPISVGGGTPALPQDHVVNLELRDERRFSGGSVFLRYRVM